MQTPIPRIDIQCSEAIFDLSGQHRYWLSHTWDSLRPAINFIMLNPSTADQYESDPTIRRCLGYAADWGFGTLVVTNLFSFRSPAPHALFHVKNPVGPKNQHYLIKGTKSSDFILVAWGNHGKIQNQHKSTLQLLRPYPLHALGVTQEGYPRHPLYLKRQLHPEPYPNAFSPLN